MEGLRECPRGLLRTIAYTQLCEAIEKDFGIELPRKTGKEIPKVIDELINIRATDPLLKRMAEALRVVHNSTPRELMYKCRTDEKLIDGWKALQEYNNHVGQVNQQSGERG